MNIPIVNGIYTDKNSDFRVSYPKNLIPIPERQGISEGYLRPGEGITAFTGSGPGIDRGGINWNGVCYRVMGSQLVSIMPSKRTIMPSSCPCITPINSKWVFGVTVTTHSGL